MKNKGLSSIMLLAMMAFAFVVFVFLTSNLKSEKKSQALPSPTTATVSQSSDSATIKQELDQTDIEFPNEELESLENELQSL